MQRWACRCWRWRPGGRLAWLRESELSCRGSTLGRLDVTPCLGSRPQTHCREVDQLPGKAWRCHLGCRKVLCPSGMTLREVRSKETREKRNLWMGPPRHSGSPPTSSRLCALNHEVRALGSQRKLRDHLTEFWRENPGWSGHLCCRGEWPCGSHPSRWRFTPEDCSPALPPSSLGCRGQAFLRHCHRTRHTPRLNGFLPAPCPMWSLCPLQVQSHLGQTSCPVSKGNRGLQIPGLDSLWTSTEAVGSGSWGRG